MAVNVSVAGPTSAGYVTLFPEGHSVLLASTINFSFGQIRTNNAVLNLSEDGTGSIGAQALVSNGGQVHLIMDAYGYFE